MNRKLLGLSAAILFAAFSSAAIAMTGSACYPPNGPEKGTLHHGVTQVKSDIVGTCGYRHIALTGGLDSPDGKVTLVQRSCRCVR